MARPVRVIQDLRWRLRGQGVGSRFGATGTGTSVATPVSLEEPMAKRPRTELGDTSRQKDKEMIEILEGTEEEQDGGSIGKESEAKGMARARDIPRVPEFHHYSGRLIHHTDSASRNIGTVYRVL